MPIHKRTVCQTHKFTGKRNARATALFCELSKTAFTPVHSSMGYSLLLEDIVGMDVDIDNDNGFPSTETYAHYREYRATLNGRPDLVFGDLYNDDVDSMAGTIDQYAAHPELPKCHESSEDLPTQAETKATFEDADSILFSESSKVSDDFEYTPLFSPHPSTVSSIQHGGLVDSIQQGPNAPYDPTNAELDPDTYPTLQWALNLLEYDQYPVAHSCQMGESVFTGQAVRIDVGGPCKGCEQVIPDDSVSQTDDEMEDQSVAWFDAGEDDPIDYGKYTLHPTTAELIAEEYRSSLQLMMATADAMSTKAKYNVVREWISHSAVI